MSTLALIKEAIIALKDRTGSSTIAINKWLETEKKVSALPLAQPTGPSAKRRARVFRPDGVRVRWPDSPSVPNILSLVTKPSSSLLCSHGERMMSKKLSYALSFSRCALAKFLRMILHSFLPPSCETSLHVHAGLPESRSTLMSRQWTHLTPFSRHSADRGQEAPHEGCFGPRRGHRGTGQGQGQLQGLGRRQKEGQEARRRQGQEACHQKGGSQEKGKSQDAGDAFGMPTGGQETPDLVLFCTR